MGDNNTPKLNLLKVVSVLLVVVLLISTAFLFLNYWEKKQSYFPLQSEEKLESVINHNGNKYVKKSNIETFLVIGLDKFEGIIDNSAYNNDRQADFLILLVFDNDNNKVSAIHINRDTITDVNILGVAGEKISTVKKQVALSHTYGNGTEVSAHNTKDAVSSILLGMKIDHYVSLTMDSVAVANDLVGGVEVTVLDDFTGIDSSLVKGEYVTLNGEQALHYVQSRYGLEDSTNNNRMERQRQFLKSLHSKTIDSIEKDDQFIVNATLKMADYLQSDRSVTQLQDLLRKFSDYEFLGIDSLEGESKVGEKFMEFYPDEASLTETVIEHFYTLEK